METSAGQPTILITGGAGLLGSRLVPLLARDVSNYRIISVSRRDRYIAPDSLVEVIYGDLRDEQVWSKIPTTITNVIHLAAMIPWQTEQKSQRSVLRDNLLPIAKLIEHSQHWPNLQQVIYSSSISVYSPTSNWLTERSQTSPGTLYGAAKLLGEDLLNRLAVRGVRPVSLRFGSIYGPGQYAGTVLPIMVKRAQQGQDILIFGDGTRTQDFLYCEDAAHAVLLTLQRGAGGVYNIGTGTPTTMTELAQVVSRVFSKGETKVVYERDRDDGDTGVKLDVSKARDELNYKPQISLEHGLRKLKQEMKT